MSLKDFSFAQLDSTAGISIDKKVVAAKCKVHAIRSCSKQKSCGQWRRG